jgi:hypothetical protein
LGWIPNTTERRNEGREGEKKGGREREKKEGRKEINPNFKSSHSVIDSSGPIRKLLSRYYWTTNAS